MVAAGSIATATTIRRGEPPAIWAALGYFTIMEGLQAVGYSVIDACGSAPNTWITALSYLHIAFQPLFINGFAMAIAPSPVAPATRRRVWVLASAASALLLFRLVPLDALGTCRPGDVLCGPAWCLVSGNWHIAWEVPLNDLPRTLGIPVQFPAYLAAVFLLPLTYGSWRFVVFHAVFGPILALALTNDPNEMPAVWCLFSIGILIAGLSPELRRKAFAAGA